MPRKPKTRRLKAISISSRRAKDRFAQLSEELAEIGRDFHRRGWLFGTSGNLSAVVENSPIRLAITATGLDKSALDPTQILEIDDSSRVLRGMGRSSNETGLHLAIVRARGAGAVLHTHSVWSTIVSESIAADGGLAIEGFEMLKGLDGIATHEHREWLPVLENRQDIPLLAGQVETLLAEKPAIHGFLIRRHGLYTWGRTLAEAKRHIEIFEFLLEVVGRGQSGASSVPIKHSP